ncbi:membrane protein [Pilimelia terevasa]|uniref:Membrane protein n=1 Tax=Pilimelia terevasa TaxID=53372 RepID=A0A8J3FI65_9ACTN|nr:neutral zinc metallopeptidase [Pilimelia terevasa]GGK24087.1 membrane protein [Pilimelia terevasa]
MELNDKAQIDTSQVDDLRGSSGGGGGLGGGGLGGLPLPTGRGGWLGLIVAVLATVIGGGTFGYQALTEDGAPADQQALAARCAQADKLRKLDCRNTLYVNSVQDYWRDALPQRLGKPYQPAKTNFFSGAVRTGCGNADAGVGPFYCPADRNVYIDLTFYRTLADQLGAPGEFAQPYVIAHEYGHHVQTLLGTEAQMRRAQQRDPGNANRYSVKLELQADCYAGAWAHHATGTDDQRGVPLFSKITDADIQEGLDTAARIGDDAIQQKMGGRVNESAFTHGSSADRQRWFRTGYDTGDPTRCDTFAAA